MCLSDGIRTAVRGGSGACRSHRALLQLLVGLSCAAALTLRAADDPKEIVRRALEVFDHESELVKQYTYVERTEERKLDGSGAVKSRDIKTWDVTELQGRQYRHLIQHNDKPLTPKEEQEEEARRQKNAAMRRKTAEMRGKETPDERQRRLDARDRRRKQAAADRDEIVDSFDLRIVGEEQIDGLPTWVVEGSPRKGYKFKDKDFSFLSKLKGRIWVAKADYQPVKVEAESFDTISFRGILARIQKGARIHMEYTRVNDEVWLPKRFTVAAAARILLVKGLHEEEDQTYSAYKKFSAESRMIDDKQ